MARRRRDDDDFMFYDRDTEPFGRRGPSPDSYDMRDPYRRRGKHTLLIVLAVIVLLLVGITAGAVLYSTMAVNNQSTSVPFGTSNNTVSQNNGAASGSSGSASSGSSSTADSSTANNSGSTSGSTTANDSGNTAGVTQAGAPVFPYVSASSELEPMSKYSYYVSHLVDGDFATSWIEGVSGYGAGQTVTFKADQQQLVSGIRIMNGYCRNKDRYYLNSRVKTLRIDIPNDSTSTFDVNLKDEYRTWNNIQFDQPIPSDTVTLTILDTYAGTQYADTGLAEIEFY